MILCAAIAGAQDTANQNDNEQPKFPYFRIELPGGVYAVRLDAINSVSLQRYVLDGSAQVTELNVSVSGVMQPRFYFIEPLTAGPTSHGQQAIQSVQERAAAAERKLNPGSEETLATRVVKTYPTTTHAGTIEYRLESLQQLEQLHRNLEQAWLTRISATMGASQSGNGSGGNNDQE